MIGNITAQADPAIRKMREQLAQIEKSRVKSSIDTMLRCGKALTRQEMEYLRVHDPQRYQLARGIQAQREAYRQALSRVRSKQEARNLRRDYAALYAAQSGGAGAQEAQMRLNAMAQEHDRFTATAPYARLPEKTPSLKRRAGGRARVNLTI